jgi:hypothetical protein
MKKTHTNDTPPTSSASGVEAQATPIVTIIPSNIIPSNAPIAQPVDSTSDASSNEPSWAREVPDAGEASWRFDAQERVDHLPSLLESEEEE